MRHHLPLAALGTLAAATAHAGAYLTLDAGYLLRDDRITASAGRTDVAGSFGRDLAGFELTLGARFRETRWGAHRLALSTGYYGDHVPSWMAEMGADLLSGFAARDERAAREDNVSDYRFRTEEYAAPLSLAYDYEFTPFEHGPSFYAGPVAGITTHVLRTNFSGKLDSDAGVSAHYGLRAGMNIPVGKNANFIHLGYEYLRETDDTYRAGVTLHYADRDSHRITLGITSRF